MKIEKIGQEQALYIAEHQEMYPEAMREDEETFRGILRGEFCWGMFDDGGLAGWILFKDESDKRPQVYCYDLAVLSEYQGRGFGRKLWVHAARELRWLDYAVRVHCRRTSYEIFADYGAGYRVATDLFIRDHYAVEYGDDSLIGEHAHELVLIPRGR